MIISPQFSTFYTMTAQDLYQRLKTIQPGSVLCNYSIEACENMIPMINEILELKKQQNAVIFAHSYVSPEIIYSVADFDGDSFKLSQDATIIIADPIISAIYTLTVHDANILTPH